MCPNGHLHEERDDHESERPAVEDDEREAADHDPREDAADDPVPPPLRHPGQRAFQHLQGGNSIVFSTFKNGQLLFCC